MARWCDSPTRQPVSPFAYKYNYFGRILDEYVCHELLRCLAERRKICIVYEGKNYRRYRAQGGDGKSVAGKVIIPLRVVYDHQYGRWYLIGVDDDATKARDVGAEMLLEPDGQLVGVGDGRGRVERAVE